jgi:hypothetical protein
VNTVVTEKFSRLHRVHLNERLRDALQEYVRCEYRPRFRYLFSSIRNPQRRPSGLCKHVVNLACRRAGVGPFHPHQFRSLMVTLFVKYCGGNALDKASKFLGHATPSITFASYWHTDAEQLANRIPFFRPPTDSGPADTGGGVHSDSYGTRQAPPLAVNACRRRSTRSRWSDGARRRPNCGACARS